MIDVCLLGTGGMLPLPGRALTALYVRHGADALLIDCGEGTQTAIRSACVRFNPLRAILITHLHADHVAGLPGLLFTLCNEGRTQPLKLYGPAGLEKTVRSLCAIVPGTPFEIEFHEFGQMDRPRFSCAGLTIDSFPGDHGIPCRGYRMTLERKGKFDPEKAREKGIPVRLWKKLQQGEAAEGFTPDQVLGPPRRGLSLLYATDTRPVPAIQHYAREVDLLILEGMFGEPEKKERALVSRHMMMREAADIAKQAKARELWLTHFSPATPYPEMFTQELREIFPNTVIGRDGMCRTLHFDD